MRDDNAYQRALYAERTPRKKYDKHLKSRYGISHEQFDKMLDNQRGGCASCGTTDPGARNFHVDHDHDTGKVRGLLCRGCNIALGLLKDDPYRISSLLIYRGRYGVAG